MVVEYSAFQVWGTKGLRLQSSEFNIREGGNGCVAEQGSASHFQIKRSKDIRARKEANQLKKLKNNRHARR
jgi:hypothetical protein